MVWKLWNLSACSVAAKGRLFVTAKQKLMQPDCQREYGNVAGNWPLLRSWPQALTTLHLQGACRVIWKTAQWGNWRKLPRAAMSTHEEALQSCLGRREAWRQNQWSKALPSCCAWAETEASLSGHHLWGWGYLLMWRFCALTESTRKEATPSWNEKLF